MTLLDRLNTAELAPMPQAPVLVLSHPGVGDDIFDLLANPPDRFQLVFNQAEFVLELAKAWHVLSSFDPLARHRASKEATPPDDPWYGAERTDPEAMARAMAQAASLHLGADGKRLMLVSQIPFWEVSDCRPLVDFVLGWHRNARILMLSAPIEQASVAVAEQHQWQLVPSENTAQAMANVFAELRADLGACALIWDLPTGRPDALPADVAEFVA